jgi:hypothetical protein
MNQGYIRRWIGEVLLAKQEYTLAANFLEAARAKWEQVSPPRASEIMQLQARIEDQLPPIRPATTDEIERICRDWILGRPMDARVR